MGAMRGWLAIALLVAAVALVACSGDGNTPGATTDVQGGDTGADVASDSGTDQDAGQTPSSGVVAPPGLYDQTDGTVQALGLLTYRNEEGGFWAVVNTVQADEAGTASVVAVVKPDDDIAARMESFRGKYVSIIGKREDDRTYQAGPYIEGRTIEEVVDTAVN